MNRASIFILLVIAVAVAARAQQEAKSVDTAKSETNRTVITSKHLNFDYKRMIAEFEGDVVVTDPRIRIESNQLNVIFDKDNNVRSVTAIGNVRIQQGEKQGTCHKAIYLSGKREIIMIGGAELSRPSESLMADEITFFIGGDDVDSVKAVGNVRLQSGGRGFSGESGQGKEKEQHDLRQ